MQNIHPETGVAYGYISANALDEYTVDALMYGPQAHNETYHSAMMNEINRQIFYKEIRDESDFDEQAFADSWEDYEPTISGIYQDVHYVSSWLGGALNFFIIQSPFITDKGRMASPCVPHACILDSLDGSVSGYNVPDDWRRED